jgi:hypothetical protein
MMPRSCAAVAILRVLIEHTDAVDTEEGRRAGWPHPLNDQRIAYLGSQGWPEIQTWVFGALVGVA